MSFAQKISSEMPAIPDRLYFKIGDVARICGVESYVLRFWETRFPQLKPNKSGNGQRLYRRRDVEMALKIKQLVHDEGYTLAGARQALDGLRSEAKGPVVADAAVEEARKPEHKSVEMAQSAERPETAKLLGQIKAELREIVAMLSEDAPSVPELKVSEAIHLRPKRAKVATMPAVSGSLFAGM